MVIVRQRFIFKEQDKKMNIRIFGTKKCNDTKECGIKMYSYPDGNHSLECGNIGKDIAVLEEVMEITESYIG